MSKSIKRILSIVCIATILMTMFCEGVFAAKTIITDDFEENTAGEAVSYKDVWSELTNAISLGDDDNMYAEIRRGSITEGSNSVILRDYPSAPEGDYLITSLDFMIPEGSNPDFTLQTTWRAGKGHGAKAMLSDKVIYNSDFDKTGPVSETLEEGRWYNVLILTNLPEDTYTVYFGENSSTRIFGHTREQMLADPNKKNYTTFQRVFLLINYSEEPLYVDNAGVYSALYPELDIALFKARNLLINSNEGYEEGQYPKSAFDMLKSEYDGLAPLVITADALGDETIAEYKDALDSAIEAFTSSKIDSSSSSSDLAFVKVADDMPVSAIVDPAAGYTLELKAAGYTAAGAETADEVVWTLENELTGVSINNNTLTVQPNCGGIAVLKATAGEKYVYHEIDLTPVRAITITDVQASDGIIKVNGEVSGNVNNDLDVKVVASELGINITDKFTVNADNTFIWQGSIPVTTDWGIIEITVSGDGIFEKKINETYYGVGWEEGIKESFNNPENTAEDTGVLLSASGRMLELDAEHYAVNSEVYNERIKAGAPYETLNDIKKSIDEINFIIEYSKCTRANVSDLITENIILLTNNGFDNEAYKALSGTVLTNFYVNAARVEVKALESTVKDIADALNILTKSLSKEEEEEGGVVEQPSKPSRPSSSGGGGGGGGGGGYMVKPVEIESVDAEEEKEEPVKLEAEGFKDVAKDHWAIDALNYMKEKEIMIGDGNGNALASKSLTRGEAAKILVLAFNLEGAENSIKFTDAHGKWWESYAEIASSCNIVNGMGDGSFGGDKEITREMLAVMLARVIKTKSLDLYDHNDGAVFNDDIYISDYAKDAVALLAKKGIVSGVGGNLFAPNIAVTRAEMAQMVYNILKQK